MKRKLIIDANLLLLLVIGAVEEGRHIGASKRLNGFSLDDYDDVLKMMSGYEVFITPYIATEVSNLIDLKGHAKSLAYEVARNLFSVLGKIDVDIDADCGSTFFPVFGITDTSLIKLAKEYIILTNDHRMLTALYHANPNNVIPYVKRA